MKLSICERKENCEFLPAVENPQNLKFKLKNRNLLDAWTTRYTGNEKTSHTNVLTFSDKIILAVNNSRMNSKEQKIMKYNKLKWRRNDIFRVACEIVVEEKPVDASTWYYLFFEFYAEKGKKN